MKLRFFVGTRTNTGGAPLPSLSALARPTSRPALSMVAIICSGIVFNRLFDNDFQQVIDGIGDEATVLVLALCHKPI